MIILVYMVVLYRKQEKRHRQYELVELSRMERTIYGGNVQGCAVEANTGSNKIVNE